MLVANADTLKHDREQPNDRQRELRHDELQTSGHDDAANPTVFGAK